MLQRAAINAAPVSEVPPIVHEVLRSPGQPLDTATRAFMEPRLGHDFSGVRIHTDAQSAKSARAVNALAYTVGQDVAFGTGQFAPGTSAGRKLIAHELTHVVQQERTRQTLAPSLEVGAANGRSEIEATVAAERLQAGSTINFVSPLSIPLLQRSPNEKGSTEGKGGELNPYEEEQEVIRYAIGARESGKLANGVVLYNAKYWRAAAISDSAFYVGPFTSDMGNFYYVYRFIGSDEKTSTYTLSRSTYLPGRDTKDLEASLARVQGGKTLEFKTTGLIPPSGGAVAKAVKKEASKGDEGKKVGGEGASKPEDAEDVQVLTPQRKKWLTAGRENMKHEIIALFNEIQKVKAARIGTWEKNANIKDPKPIRAALEVAIEIVGYGMGGVVGGYLTHAMAHGLAQEFAKEALLKSTVKLAEFLFEHAVEPAEEFLAEETEKALKENGKGNAVGALASKSSLLDCYVEAMTLQSLSEERVQTREFNANVDKKYTDLDLADTVIVFEKLWQILFNEPKAFLRELSEGLIRLKDEMYVQEKAKEYGGDVEKALRKDDDIVATDRRSGNLLMVVDGMAGGNELSYWYNP
ncbi:MAG TPA: DUF4157 domain-containing protein, partial [Anaerolineae bacterium]|nr:DUF4157 domain-containing protein [Anaerolineae bacterium]